MSRFRTNASLKIETALAILAVSMWGAVTGLARAELRFANVFSGNMVLQQEKPIPVWGIAEPNQEVEVTLGDEKATTTADKDGRWSVEFGARSASFDSVRLSVTSGDKVVTHENILIGEVWLCGGQSNMAPAGHHNSDLEFPCADSDGVRYTRIDSGVAAEPLYDIRFRDGWMPLVAGKMELRRISPVAYYFGIRLNRFLKVPVGIINTSVGGTTAEVWASPKTLRAIPELKYINADLGKDLGAFYNGTIIPLSKLHVRGVLFYQGENNTFELFETYAHSFPSVIRDWRQAFGNDQLPFGIITLAGNKAMNGEPNPEGEMTHRHSYTHIRDVHFRTFRSTPNTGLIAIHDLGEDDMHPGCKRDVGERSARWALATVYGAGQKSTRDGGVYHTAPIYREMKVDGDRVLLYFNFDPTVDDRRAGKWYKRLPLPRRAREYRGFVIAGKDRQWFPAQAKVRAVKNDGDDMRKECLEVWSEDVPEPVAVRYAWENQPNANAYGLHGIPVAPFRTDDWPFIRAEPNWAADLEQRKAENEKTKRQSEQWRRERTIGELKRKLRALGVEVPEPAPEE
jgi:sialate O-acetylesterase